MSLANILIVEDEYIVASDLQRLLTGLNYAVVAIASAGEEAIRLALLHKPDLVLMDIMLAGEMDGIEAAGTIHDRIAAPVVFLTSYANDSILDKAKKANPFGYLVKPFKETELRIAIEMALHRAQLESRLRGREQELQEANSLLSKSRERLQTILDGIEAIVYVADMETREVLFANNYAKKQFGEVEGQLCWRVLQDGMAEPCGFCPMARLISPDGSPSSAITWEYQNTKNKKWYECHERAVEWLDGRFVKMQIATDITSRKRMEAELLRTRNLESICRLAGGIAHDFNNLMTSIFGYIELSQMLVRDNEKASMFLSHALRSAEQTRILTNKLLTFSQGGTPAKQVARLPQLVTESLSFLLNGSNVSFEIRADDDPWPVEIDKEQISQVVHNIVLNSLEAMPEGGKIQVRMENRIIEIAENLPLTAGPYVRLSLTDTGRGISPRNLPRVFDPYFTTKEKSAQKGVGLGLTTSFSIIQQHKGYIGVESEAGKGTTCSIYLPAASAARQYLASRTEKTADTPIHVLFMDDEEILRNVAAEMIKYLGYRADFVKDGQEAVSRYQEAWEKNEPFDLIILDLMVSGGMGGIEAMEKLRAINPEVKLVISSGYSDDPVLKNHERHGFNAALAKPYQIRILHETIQKALNR